MESTPDSTDTRLLDAGFYSEVVERFRDCREGPQLRLLIEALSLGGFHEEAVALSDSIDNPTIRDLNLKADALWRSGNLDTAIACLSSQLHLRKDKELDSVESQIADFEIRRGNYQKADALLLSLLTRSNTTNTEFTKLVRHSLITFLLPDEVAYFVKQAPHRVINNDSSDFRKARNLSDLGLHDVSENLFGDALRNQVTPTGELILARRALSKDDYDTAISHINAALAMEGSDCDIYTCLGEVLQKAGDPDRALKYFTTAIKRQPLDKRARISICTALVDANQGAKAVKLVEELYFSDPLNKDIHRCIVRLNKQGHRTIPMLKFVVKIARDVGSNRTRSEALKSYLQRR